VKRPATLAVAAVLAAHGLAASGEPAGERCSVITRQDNGAPKTTPMDGLKVIELTAREGAFALPRGAPKDVQALLCKRQTVVPAPHDYEVLQAGFTLYLTDELARMAALGRVEGKVQLDMLDGALTTAERLQADQRLREFQSALDGAKP
jgi:hypothetical protein